ncbi:MAG: hypothetical protein IPK19_03125 [Chloroflexi bacterium]|nr:hypothetical protein [Chloroflexota bacterium]
MLLAVGVGFAALSGLNDLLKTVFRRNNVGFLDLLLTFLGLLLPVSALIVAHLGETPDPMIAQFVLMTAGVVAAAHLLILLLELFRPQRLRGSRGLLGIFAGLLMGFSAIYVPFLSVYFSLDTERAPAVSVAAAPTRVGGSEDSSDATAVAEAEQRERFAELFRTIFGFVADETELDELEIVDRLEAGTPLAKIITDNGGDVDKVVRQIAEVTREAVRESAADGSINPIQAALAVSQMETLIRFLVNSDITRLGERMGGATPVPDATQPSLRALFLTPESDAATPSATEPPIAQPSVQPTATPSSIPDPTATRTPAPTLEPTATRFVFATRTPTATLTPVRPCLASVEYNLRLRAAPDYDSETLVVIPYGTTVELYRQGGLTEGGAIWWLAEYEGQQGWLDGEFMLVSTACEALPPLGR